jgi:hypothetical protein
MSRSMAVGETSLGSDEEGAENDVVNSDEKSDEDQKMGWTY